MAPTQLVLTSYHMAVYHNMLWFDTLEYQDIVPKPL